MRSGQLQKSTLKETNEQQFQSKSKSGAVEQSQPVDGEHWEGQEKPALGRMVPSRVRPSWLQKSRQKFNIPFA